MKYLIALALSLSLIGCGQAVKADPPTIAKSEYEQLKKDAALAKQIGRYQIHKVGDTTWRLDTATGEHCLLLAPVAYWKNPANKTDEFSCTVQRRLIDFTAPTN